MKKALWAGTVLALAAACPIHADDAGNQAKQAKVAELMKLQGQYDLIEQMRADALKRAETLRPQYQKQLRDSFPDAPADLWTHFDAAYTRFLEASRKTWSTQDAVDLFGKLYGNQLTDEELDQILAYYRSPIGQKDVQATKIATPQWTGQLAQMAQKGYQANLQVFLDDVRDFAKQCKASLAAGANTCETPAPEGSKT